MNVRWMCVAVAVAAMSGCASTSRQAGTVGRSITLELDGDPAIVAEVSQRVSEKAYLLSMGDPAHGRIVKHGLDVAFVELATIAMSQYGPVMSWPFTPEDVELRPFEVLRPEVVPALLDGGYGSVSFDTFQQGESTIDAPRGFFDEHGPGAFFANYALGTVRVDERTVLVGASLGVWVSETSTAPLVAHGMAEALADHVARQIEEEARQAGLIVRRRAPVVDATDPTAPRRTK
jgi:hypothetical protein